MSCIYEIFKDLCIDCIFCNEDQIEEISERNRFNNSRSDRIKKKNKGTQTDINYNIKEPGSI